MSALDAARSAADRLSEAVAKGNAIAYLKDSSDKEHPELRWSIYGLPRTGEIAVLVAIADLSLAMTGASPLLVPAMEDRIFGIDVADQQLADELSDTLWSQHADVLIAAVHRLRGSG
jgi:hypothetical protein